MTFFASSPLKTIKTQSSETPIESSSVHRAPDCVGAFAKVRNKRTEIVEIANGNYIKSNGRIYCTRFRRTESTGEKKHAKNNVVVERKGVHYCRRAGTSANPTSPGNCTRPIVSLENWIPSGCHRDSSLAKGPRRNRLVRGPSGVRHNSIGLSACPSGTTDFPGARARLLLRSPDERLFRTRWILGPAKPHNTLHTVL